MICASSLASHPFSSLNELGKNKKLVRYIPMFVLVAGLAVVSWIVHFKITSSTAIHLWPVGLPCNSGRE